MPKKPTPDRRHGERLLKERQAIAKEFGIADASDWRLRRLALYRSQLAAAEDMHADGRPLDIGDLLALGNAIDVLTAALRADEPIEAHLKILSRHVGVCKCGKCGAVNTEYDCIKCGERNDIAERKEPEPLPAPPPEPPVAVFARPIDETERPADEPATAAKPDGPQVTYRSGVSVSKFHSAVVNGVSAPLKSEQPSPYQIRKISPMGG